MSNTIQRPDGMTDLEWANYLVTLGQDAKEQVLARQKNYVDNIEKLEKLNNTTSYNRLSAGLYADIFDSYRLDGLPSYVYLYQAIRMSMSFTLHLFIQLFRNTSFKRR